MSPGPHTAVVTGAPAVVFVCSPLGSQWRGMARQLLASEPVFRAALGRCDRAFRPRLGRSIRDDLAGDWQAEDDVIRAQPLLFAVQVGLAALLRSWGVAPAAVLGHSAGEIAAAHIAGLLDLEQAAEVVTHYARVQRSGAGRGAMAIVALPAAVLADRLDPRVVVAAHNSATSTVISGEAGPVASLLADLQAEGVACSPIRTDVAGHSPLVRDGLPELLASLADLRPTLDDPAVRFVSCVRGGPLDRPTDGAYWADNLGSPVRFAAALHHLLADGLTLFVELGPHPVISHAIRECAAQAGRSVTVLPTLRRAADERLPLLATRAALFLAGAGDPPPAPPAELLVLSAPGPAGLARTAARTADWLDRTPLAAADLAHAAARRSHRAHRLAVVGRTPAELSAALRRREPAPPTTTAPPLVIFVFPGQGSQWSGMGRSLYADQPAFRARLQACDRALAPYFPGSVIAELHAPPGRARLDRSDIVQPVLWAVSLALAELWRAWGVQPDAVVGHSMGEIAAACVAGSLSLADGARLVAERSRIARAHAGGAMAVVELALPDALAALADLADRLVVGVHNGPRECVLSGDPDALTVVLTRLEARGVFCRRVRVDYASHSPHMDAIREPLLAALAGLTPRPGAVPMLSTLRVDWQPGEAMGPAYWAANIREPVRFAPAIERLLVDAPADHPWRDRPRIFLEQSPHPLLLTAIRDLLPATTGHRALGSLRRDEDERSCLLTSAAELFAAGLDLDLAALHPDGGRVVSLPPPAWQRTPHWFTASPAPSSPARPRGPGHPILGLAFTTPAHPGSHIFTATLSAAALPYLDDHRVGDAAIVPAATWLDLALAAARSLGRAGPLALRDLSFHAALVLPPAGAEIQLALLAEPDGALSFTGHGRAAESWSHHVSGRITSAPDLEDMSARTCPEDQPLTPVPADSFYAALARRGLRYGPRCRGVVGLRIAGGRVVAELAPPAGSAAPGAVLQPVLLDAALHALVAGLPDDGRALVPVAIAGLHVAGELASACTLTGRIDPATLRADLQLRDPAGRPLLTVDGLQLHRLAPTRVRDDDLLTRAWRELPPPSPTATPRRWLLAGDPADPLTARLGEHLRRAGDEVVLLPPTEDPAARLDAGPWHGLLHLATPTARELPPTAPTDRELPPTAPTARELHRTNAPTDRELPRTHAPTDRELPPAPAREFTWTDALDAADALLRRTQALLRARARDLPRLVLLTRGAVALADAAPRSLAHAPLWGLALALAYEHPELRSARIDLSPEPPDDELRALATELRAEGPEDQLALRGDRRLAARLVRGSFLADAPIDLSSGTCLITGGLGDFGLALAERLVARGCRHLALLGRAGATQPAQHAALARLHAAGARVDCHAIDVADPDPLARILADLPDLVAVFHAAGLLADAVVTHQDRDTLARVMAPKIAGAWNLHRLTRDRPLRCFALFSSVAALVGSPGQSNYAAANTFLDALAAHRHALGLPALAVQWGAIADIGLAARDDRRGARLAARGMRPLPVDRALDHLERLLADPSLTSVGVAPLDLRQWLEFHLAVAAAPYFSELRTTAAEPPTTAAASQRDELLALAPAERLRQVEALLRAQALRVLRVDGERLHRHTSLLELGIDSLTGLELRNRLESALGLRLPASLAWTYPRLDLLAAHLDARLADERPPTAEPLAPPAAPTLDTNLDPTPDPELADLSDDDLLRALAAELERSP